MSEHTVKAEDETAEPVGAPETPETAPEAPTPATEPEATPTPQPEGEGEDPEGEAPEGEDPETFPREYVQQLRAENAAQRVKANRADDLAARLHTALVTASGKLADPEDLPYDAAHLEDPAALDTAIGDLLARKPHLGSRVPAGDIGQGHGAGSPDVSLAGILRNNAM